MNLICFTYKLVWIVRQTSRDVSSRSRPIFSRSFLQFKRMVETDQPGHLTFLSITVLASNGIRNIHAVRLKILSTGNHISGADAAGLFSTRFAHSF